MALVDKMKEFFSTDEWNYDEPRDGVLTMRVEAQNTQFNCVAQVREEGDLFAFYTISQQIVPEEMRANAAMFVTHANYGMLLGNFEMDLSDGEIRYKTTMAVPDGYEPDLEAFKLHIYTNIMTHDRYYPGIMQVVYAGVDPETACGSVEKEEVPEDLN